MPLYGVATSEEKDTLSARLALLYLEKSDISGLPPGEFAEKYLRKGMKIAVTGRIQTGSYTNREGQKVYTTDVIVEEHEFAESKAASESNSGFAPMDRPRQ